MPRYPHLFLNGPDDTRGFTSPQSGGGGAKFPPRDRLSHAATLRAQLDRCFEQDKARKVAAVADKGGTYLSFESSPGFDLATKSLEAKRLGIRMVNIQEVGPDNATITRATVFVPSQPHAVAHFLRKIAEYETQFSQQSKAALERAGITDQDPKPMNAALIEGIAEIKLALLEHGFWADSAQLIPKGSPDWVEAWLGSGDLGVIERFRSLCSTLKIQVGEGVLTFPERTVLLICASQSQLVSLIENSPDVAEFRAAKEVASFFLSESNRDQTARVEHLLDRVSMQSSIDVAVLVLDHGVNNGHRLLEPLLADEDRHAVIEEWGKHDHHGHGTLMAGTAAYGDLLSVLQSDGPVRLTHRLESAKILPRPPAENPKQLWGHFMAQGVSRAQIQAPSRRRIVCMAVTSSVQDRGRPSSWSGKLDEMASGYEGDIRRLIIVSAGNVADEEDWKRYPASNRTAEVHDPAQAWNALTVGAFTAKTRLVDPTMAGWSPLADAGGLSPFSSTSTTWNRHRWPIKPEVLFEGGNIAKNETSGEVALHDDLSLVSTYYVPQVKQFAAFDQTSAATAQAAWMAAKIQAAYPNAWPETVRALIVHSAEWTPAQKRAFLSGDRKVDYCNLARVCGYGVPNLERALYCASNSLTLIAQESIQPFDKMKSDYKSKDMHLFRLPWPAKNLLELGETPVTMRVTLSYFIEPSPGEIGWNDRYRYASHALRFELNAPGESEEDFIERVNAKEREDPKVGPGTRGPNDHWALGETRDVGSLHSDVWTGTAADLSDSHRLIVYPAIGWWRERSHLGRWNRRTRYALIVSIHLPGQEVDIYTPVAQQITLRPPVEIEIPVI